MKANGILINDLDNVITVTSDILPNEKVYYFKDEELMEVVANSQVPAWNKLAVADVLANDHVLKYGEIIGRASQDIVVGDYVSHLNVESLPRDYQAEMKEEE